MLGIKTIQGVLQECSFFVIISSSVDHINFGIQGKNFFTSTQTDKPLDEDIASNAREHSGPIRARSRSLVRSIKKLTRSISCSGSIPRYVMSSNVIDIISVKKD